MVITCPHCGNTSEKGKAGLDLHGPADSCVGFYLLEEVTVWRQVVDVRADGTPVVDGLSHTGEGYDDGVEGSLRLECRKCLAEFPLPCAPGDIEYV